MDLHDPTLADLNICVTAAINRQAPHCLALFQSQYSNASGFWFTATDAVQVMNRFFRYKLALVPVDTLKARQALEDGINPMIWAQNFERYVLPVMIRHVWS